MAAAASNTSLVESIAHPNFFFLLTDDQDTMLGGAAHMPAVRELLVAGGANFTNAFVHTPICCPSRSSYLTGRYLQNSLTIESSCIKILRFNIFQSITRRVSYLPIFILIFPSN